MPRDGLKALGQELRATPPAGLAALDDAQLRDLTEAVRDARHRQAAELKTAGDQALSHIPKLLRIPVRKVLG
jgi:hypothetical protein